MENRVAKFEIVSKKQFASDFVDIQRTSFKRLGVLGEWDRPYLTMAPSFEAEEVIE